MKRGNVMQGLKRRMAGAVVSTLVLVAGGTQAVRAQGDARAHHDSGETRGKAGALIRAVQQSTERYKDVAAAEADGYGLMFGCVSGPDQGAMGLHYVNFPLVQDITLDPAKPEIVIYEPLPNGRKRLVGADFLVFAADWHAKHAETPKVMGQLMHLIESPNRYGLPAFYTLHVWAWKESPAGPFVNWHPTVSCANFDDPND
jgi:hypothetical protein